MDTGICNACTGGKSVKGSTKGSVVGTAPRKLGSKSAIPPKCDNIVQLGDDL